LTYFDTSIILPCGIDGRGVTSIAQILMERGETKLPSVKDVGTEALAKLQSVFEIHLEPGADII
jgi:lipoate-protein ligase B